MIEDSLGQGRMFGMIQPDPTAAETETGPGLFRIGCLGRISSFSETDEGHFLITLTGLIRFAVADELAMRRGYRRVRGDFGPYRQIWTSHQPATGVSRETLLAALRGYFTHRDIDANWDAIKRLPDDMLVVTLAMVCPFEPAEKQALLEGSDRSRACVCLAGAVADGRPGARRTRRTHA